jgi:hypothetical protein
MTDRTGSTRRVTALRMGSVEIGGAVVLLDDDLLTFVPDNDEDPPVRVRFMSIEAVQQNGDRLELHLRDRSQILMTSERELCGAILSKCRVLPELTRTLRSFGSSRGGRQVSRAGSETGGEQRRFFSPLLEARRAGARAAGVEAIAAFDAPAIVSAVELVLAEFAAEREVQAGPGRRSLEAHLLDASEPLFHSLRKLNDVASAATAAVDDLLLWREWAAQLAVTFETADRAWLAVDRVLHQLGVREARRS